jgi:hypothetical protein
MKTDYSKPSADIATEADAWQSRDQEILVRQRVVSRYLENALVREKCLLCDANLKGAHTYRHRHTNYVFCGHCGHLQTLVQLPTGYPHAFAGNGFEAIYPQLDEQEFVSRRDRIYTPKLEWALSRMSEAGSNTKNALNASWMEIGCGAGYFLSALLAKGVKNVRGVDENVDLVVTANERCGEGCAQVTQDIFADVEACDADFLVAFFVLEHLEDAFQFWRILSEKPSGTIFLFAVPTFGLSTVLEGVLDNFAARNLDSVIHTQLYTDHSIDFALNMAGYDKAAEWLFGQDAQDLCRLLVESASSSMDGALGEELTVKLAKLIDPLQSAVDHARFCDARHILAVKR